MCCHAVSKERLRNSYETVANSWSDVARVTAAGPCRWRAPKSNTSRGKIVADYSRAYAALSCLSAVHGTTTRWLLPSGKQQYVLSKPNAVLVPKHTFPATRIHTEIFRLARRMASKKVLQYCMSGTTSTTSSNISTPIPFQRQHNVP